MPTNKKKKQDTPQFGFSDQFLHLFPPTTELEQKMHDFYQNVISKKDWQRKILQPELIEKWKVEAKGRSHSVFNYEDTMINWELDRLKYMANKKDTIVTVTQMVCQTDLLIPDTLKKSFVTHASPLEAILDWHPNSNDQVLNLLHPALYCLMNKKSFLTEEKMIQRNVPMSAWGGGERRVVDFDEIYPDLKDKQEEDFTVPNEYVDPEEDERVVIKPDWYVSKEFQWIPTDFSVSNEGKVQFDSYINGLHPIKHKKLYRDLEQVLEKFIPMFEQVLGDAKTPSRRLFGGSEIYDLFDEGWSSKFLDEDYEVDDYEDKHNRTFFTKVFDPNVDDQRVKLSLAGRNLQIIIKMANIELTPEKPDYNGGEWHQEGTRNEDIIATGLYYYSMENITTSILHFRCAVEQAEDIGQNSGGIFGQGFESHLSEIAGHINAIEDRCVAFANYCQHKIQPFSLQDKEKKGHRKILAFFLVNPDHERISTSRVPPQIASWNLPILKQENVLGSIFPEDIIETISGYLGSALSLEEAKRVRLDFIKERGKFVKEQGQVIYERMCNLCEH